MREGNEYIVFSCIIEGNFLFFFYWIKNGKRLNVIGNLWLIVVLLGGIYSLNIVNFSCLDVGLY